MKKVDKIVLESLAGLTIGVMKYADVHPDVLFDHTEVYVKNHDGSERYIFMVSEYQPTYIDIEGDALGIFHWWSVPNGWQRESSCEGVWVCRKNGRYIIITT